MILVLLLVLPVVVHTQYCAQTNDVYDKARNTCYHFSVPHQLDFEHAGIYCSNLNYKLLSVHSKEQNDFVASIARNTVLRNCTSRGPYDNNYCLVLAGGYRDEDSKNFLWSDGSFWNYTNWMMGEPIYDYIRINITSGVWSTDENDYDKSIAICEGPSVGTKKITTNAPRPLQTTQMSTGSSNANSTAPSTTTRAATTVRAIPAQAGTTVVKNSAQSSASPKVITTTTGKATSWSLSQVAVFFVLLLSYHY